jgi:hypothetical protein
MKSMGNSKCATFNEFTSDALTQENNNSIYAATKSRKRATPAGSVGQENTAGLSQELTMLVKRTLLA